MEHTWVKASEVCDRFQKKKENSMTEACGLTNTQVVHTSDMTTATCVSLLAQYTHMNVMYSIIKLTCKNNTLCSVPFLHRAYNTVSCTLACKTHPLIIITVYSICSPLLGRCSISIVSNSSTSRLQGSFNHALVFLIKIWWYRQSGPPSNIKGTKKIEA